MKFSVDLCVHLSDQTFFCCQDMTRIQCGLCYESNIYGCQMESNELVHINV